MTRSDAPPLSPGDLAYIEWSAFGEEKVSYGCVREITDKAVTVRSATNCGVGSVKELSHVIPWRFISSIDGKGRAR